MECLEVEEGLTVSVRTITSLICVIDELVPGFYITADTLHAELVTI
jgi:hypothetical protein